MAENSAIEWTDHTFNPWEGCQKVGPGCDHCYAETRNARYAPKVEEGAPRPPAPNWGPGAPRRRTSDANWRKPMRWQANAARFYAEHGRRQRVFCASLADVFDNAAHPDWRSDLFDLIDATPDLDWLLLTKRIGNVAGMLRDMLRFLPENVWLGATIVNQTEADRDIPKLAAIDAEVRFLSMEPLLEAVLLGEHLLYEPCPNSLDGLSMDWSTGAYECCSRCDWTGIGENLAVHWVIVGGESGPGARPMHPDWARSLRDQCEAAGVPFLFKQWGEWAPKRIEAGADLGADVRAGRVVCIHPSGRDHDALFVATGRSSEPGSRYMTRIGKKAAGRLLDGRTHDGFPDRKDLPENRQLVSGAAPAA